MQQQLWLFWRIRIIIFWHHYLRRILTISERFSLKTSCTLISKFTLTYLRISKLESRRANKSQAKNMVKIYSYIKVMVRMILSYLLEWLFTQLISMEAPNNLRYLECGVRESTWSFRLNMRKKDEWIYHRRPFWRIWTRFMWWLRARWDFSKWSWGRYGLRWIYSWITRHKWHCRT